MPGLPAAYWRLWTSSTTSNFGDGLVLVAFPLLALTLTTRPLLVAGVVVAGRLPAVVVSPIAGAIVDRVDRRRLAAGIQAVQLAVFAAFAGALLAGADSLPLLYTTIAVLGCAATAFDACATAALPSLVGPAQLELANSRLGAAQLTARELAGQGIGGVAFATARALPFAADALSFAVAAVALKGCLPDRAAPGATRRPPIRHDIAEGLRWFAASRPLRTLTAMVCTFAGCQYAVLATLVLYATRLLHLDQEGYGLLLAGGAVGGILGALGASRVVAALGSRRAMLVGGIAAAAAYLFLAAQPSVAVAGLAVALESAGVSIGNVASISLRQRVIPSELLGRVGTTVRMLILLACSLGALLGGALAGVVGLRLTFAVVGAAQLCGLGLLSRLRPPASGVIDLASDYPAEAPAPPAPLPASSGVPVP